MMQFCRKVLGVPVLKGGQNLLPMIRIGLIGLPKIGRGGGQVAPLHPPWFWHHCYVVALFDFTNFEG